MLLAACGGTNVAPRPLPDAELTALEAQVRQIATGPCGSCHTRGLRTAKRDALEVFDLADERWSRTVRGAQWDFFYGRIEGEVERTDRATVLRFVAAAKAR
jgi:mono/diheme cytochrome c family protein